MHAGHTSDIGSADGNVEPAQTGGVRPFWQAATSGGHSFAGGAQHLVSSQPLLAKLLSQTGNFVSKVEVLLASALDALELSAVICRIVQLHGCILVARDGFALKPLGVTLSAAR